MYKALIIWISSMLAAANVWAAEVGNSGLPIPRFVSLKNAETNVRTGPGTRYPIAWIYRREHLPVEVIEEFDYWRKIRDSEGTTGWVHKMMLDGSRYVMIIAREPQVLRIDHDEKSKALLKAEAGVMASLIECTLTWCRLQIASRKGWIEKKHLFGVYKEEIFD
jgi:SH3-like domain-containing protein